MAVAIDFPGSNARFGPPEGMTEEQVYTMSAYVGQGHVVSCWHLSEAELKEINQTYCVFLAVMGNGVPPMMVGSLAEVNELLAQHNQ